MRLHFTPTYSSWLNQVEIWFANIERDVLARGVFTSAKRLGLEDPEIHSGLRIVSVTNPLDLYRLSLQKW